MGNVVSKAYVAQTYLAPLAASVAVLGNQYSGLCSDECNLRPKIVADPAVEWIKNAMTMNLSDEILKSIPLGESELKAELAIALFQQDRLTLGQAALLAQMPQLDFQRMLASRKISIHYGVDELEQDLRRVAALPLA